MSPSSPVVSVVLPCYNAEHVVSHAIESVASSSLAPACELIVVNDGSTDGTDDAIVAACAQAHDLRTVVIRTKNQGVSRARNTALDVARGTYIVFLDADDCISPCMLENMSSYAEEEGADFSYCEPTADLALLCKSATVPETVPREKVFSTLLYQSRKLRFTCVLYRRDTIERLGLRFDTTLRYGEDFAFLWQYALGCSKYMRFDEPFYYYARDNENSAMHRVCWEMTDVLKAVELVGAHIPQEEHALRMSYDEYMIPRHILFLQKDFAWGGDRELFNRLREDYPSAAFWPVIIYARPVIKVSAVIYRLSPSLYFRLFHLLGSDRMRRRKAVSAL